MFQDIINNNIIIMTQKQSAPIECKNNLFKLVYSVKTTAYDQNSNIDRYFHIYKAQNKSDQTVQGIFRSVSKSLSMDWNRRLRGLIMFVFNFDVEQLEQIVKLDQLVILISLAFPLSKHQFFQTNNQKAVHFTVFSLLELFFSCCIVVAVANENLPKMPAIVLLANFAISKAYI